MASDGPTRQVARALPPHLPPASAGAPPSTAAVLAIAYRQRHGGAHGGPASAAGSPLKALALALALAVVPVVTAEAVVGLPCPAQAVCPSRSAVMTQRCRGHGLVEGNRHVGMDVLEETRGLPFGATRAFPACATWCATMPRRRLGSRQRALGLCHALLRDKTRGLRRQAKPLPLADPKACMIHVLRLRERGFTGIEPSVQPAALSRAASRAARPAIVPEAGAVTSAPAHSVPRPGRPGAAAAHGGARRGRGPRPQGG
jgi:hypothetical protein